MYGFWFDPKIDYATDAGQVAQYIRRVERLVERYKNEPVILAWNIGNESSGLLKHHFAQPYLTVVRRAYMSMIEEMIRRVHAIDGQRPVLTTLEHAQQLPGELYAFSINVPSADVIAINSYYKEQISEVHHLVHRFSPGKPYLISEFGPKGYWDQKLTDYNRYMAIEEDTDKNKALLYGKEWREDVLEHKGCNIGGIAFCWQDRYEGTATWFGLTDYKGRKKLAYYVLQHEWKGGPQLPLTDVFINGPSFSLKPGGTYEFTAVCADKSLKHFEWQLVNDDYMDEAGSLAPGSKRNKVWVTLPRKGKRFRLYLHVTTGKDKVITSSRSIAIYDGVFNDGI